MELGELERSGRGKGVLEGTATEGMGDAYWNPDAGWVNAAKVSSCG